MGFESHRIRLYFPLNSQNIRRDAFSSLESGRCSLVSSLERFGFIVRTQFERTISLSRTIRNMRRLRGPIFVYLCIVFYAFGVHTDVCNLRTRASSSEEGHCVEWSMYAHITEATSGRLLEFRQDANSC